MGPEAAPDGNPEASPGGGQASGPVLTDQYWQTIDPKDLPYAGKTPNVKSLSFKLNFASEEGVVHHGSGAISTFFTTAETTHTPGSGAAAGAFKWEVGTDERTLSLNLKDGRGRAKARLSTPAPRSC